MNLEFDVWHFFQATVKAKPAKKKLDKAASNFLDSSSDNMASKKPAAEKPKAKPKPANKKKEPWMSSDDDDDKFGGAASDSGSDFGVAKKPAAAKPKPKAKSPKRDFGDSDSDAGASWQPSKALKSSNGASKANDDGDEFDALVGDSDDEPIFGKKKPAPKKASGEKKRAAPAAGENLKLSSHFLKLFCRGLLSSTIAVGDQ